jgi:hypothetical protein
MSPRPLLSIAHLLASTLFTAVDMLGSFSTYFGAIWCRDGREKHDLLIHCTYNPMEYIFDP